MVYYQYDTHFIGRCLIICIDVFLLGFLRSSTLKKHIESTISLTIRYFNLGQANFLVNKPIEYFVILIKILFKRLKLLNEFFNVYVQSVLGTEENKNNFNR